MSDSLEVVARTATGTRESRRLRRQGLVPAILYGHGEKCVDLAATRIALEAVIRHGSRIVELKGEITPYQIHLFWHVINHFFWRFKK